MRLRCNNSAFVLVLVLLVLAVAGLLLGLAASRCCQKALRAATVRQEQQVRWGTISCRWTFLPMAETYLSDPVPGKPRATTNTHLKLGDLDFKIALSDEQAKPNVNMLAARDNLGLEVHVSQLQQGLRINLPVRPRPLESARGISRFPLLYQSMDQVFQYDEPGELKDLKQLSESPADRVTCWGSGLLNFKRSDRDALRKIAAGALTESQIDQLIKLVDKDPSCSLEQAIVKLELKPAAAGGLRRLLTDVSRCHSIWIAVEGPSYQWYRLSVRQEGDAENDARSFDFAW